jgi:ATP-dependent RNA helicase DeaD
MTTEFSQLGLKPQLAETVADLGYEAPTSIQSKVIPLMLDGNDVIAQSHTGTGKTAAFILPVLQNLKQAHSHVQALVLAPTRELALQVAKAAAEYGGCLNVRVLAVYGGQPYNRQINSLRQGVDIVVGTPGRLLDLMKKGELDLSEVNTAVLDEADEMLSMGFIDDIQEILSQIPSERQTALFSATISPEITRIANKYMRSPQSVTIKSKHLIVDAIKHRYCLVNKDEKVAVITRLFEVEDIGSTLVFVRTRAGTCDLVNELVQHGFPAEALNGDLNQETREQVLNRFRRNRTNILVATDMAARGLDIDNISHVFNYDLPDDPELYVHRVGRTARAGKTGTAISLLTAKESGRLRRIEGLTRQQITRMPIPTTEQIEKHRESKFIEEMMTWMQRGGFAREFQIVKHLVETGNEPLQIAAAALNMARGDDNQRSIASITPVKEVGLPKAGLDIKDVKARSRSNGARGAVRKGMVRLTFGAGKSQGVRPADVVGTIAYFADFPGNAIGEINILDKYTLVDIPQRFVARALAKTGKYRIHNKAVHLSLA